MSKSRNGHRYNDPRNRNRDLWGARPMSSYCKSPWAKLMCRRIERRTTRIIEREAA